MAALVFAKLFFPSSDPLTGTLQAFAVFAVGFVARPIGAAIFGHYGDRIGRKAALIATLLLTGLSTSLVGCVPTYEQIGLWGPVIMVVLRFIQGIGVGGEWGGSVLLAMEWARTSKNRGFLAAWPQFGGPAGFFLANLAILAFSQMSGDQFFSWGWRIPFWLSLVMVGIGLWIRLGILETPIFRQVVANERVAHAPVAEVLKHQPREIILVALARMGQMVPALECFTPRLRYSGASIGFQLAAVFAGGPAPMIATALLAWSGSGQVIALYIFGCAIVSVVATAALPSSRDRDFARDHL
jgi:MFS family permease